MVFGMFSCALQVRRWGSLGDIWAHRNIGINVFEISFVVFLILTFQVRISFDQIVQNVQNYQNESK